MDFIHTLGAGSYNTAYLSADRTRVYKVSHDGASATDSPGRSTRVWGALNPHLPRAYEYAEGWVSPFIEGTQASDQEMSDSLLKIYNETGRIVVDACAPNNFLTTRKQEVVCIDVGLALSLDQRRTGRRGSTASLNAWKDLKDLFTPYFADNYVTKPQTINTIKALLFIKEHTNIVNVNFLKDNPYLFRRFARAYDAPHEAEELKNFASPESNKDISQIKKALETELQHYIHSRGSLNNKNEFNASFTTRFFRNTNLTQEKVTDAKLLIEQIKRADSISGIQNLVYNATQSKNTVESKHTSLLEKTLENCLDICNSDKNYSRATPSMQVRF